MSVVAQPIPARMKGVNRAEICDVNFQEFVRDWNGRADAQPAPDEAILDGSALDARGFRELFESQLIIAPPRPDGARAARAEQGLLHDRFQRPRRQRDGRAADAPYRSGVPALPLRRLHGRALPQAAGHGSDHGFGAVASPRARTIRPPAAATRCGAASRCGCCRRPRPSPRTCPRRSAPRSRSSRRGASATQLPIPDDSIAICSFGDASSNHATAQTAFNAAAWTAYQKLPAPVLFVCEDNGIGISVKTPSGWVAQQLPATAPDLDYFYADGLDLADGYGRGAARGRTLPPHAPPDLPAPAHDPDHGPRRHRLRDRMALDRGAVRGRGQRSAAALAPRSRSNPGLMSKDEILALYEDTRKQVLRRRRGCRQPPAPDRARRRDGAARAVHAGQGAGRSRARRLRRQAPSQVFGGEAKLPENQPPQAPRDPDQQRAARPVRKYPEALLFGEDVAQKGGVYTVTKGLQKAFGGKRVFNTLLDETIILGLAQGYANMGMLPLPEIQYLAYFHNACDQIRGEAASLQFFSNDQYRNPMVMRIASLGYQRGFGGHFHNDNSITALRDIPGPGGRLPVARRRRGDDAAHAGGAGEGRRPRLRVPRTDRAVHDQGPVRSRRRRLADRISGAGRGDGARRGARLRRRGRRPA